MKIIKSLYIFFICLTVGVITSYIGYKLMAPPINIKDMIVKVSGTKNNSNNYIENENIEFKENINEENNIEVRIKENTKIIYEYVDKNFNLIKKREEYAPDFMIGKTREDLKSVLSSWYVVTFLENEVILRKVIKTYIPENYIIGEKDGYITIFYDEHIDGSNVKEITDIPILHFPEEEQERLRKGIKVSGMDELIRRMEDYSS